MSETRTQLSNRKLDLFAAIRQLEQDRRDGLVDREAYADARRRYELEAAEVLERLDGMVEAEAPAARPRRPWLPWAAGAAALAAAAILVLLLTGTRARGAAGPVTGSAPSNSSRPAQVSPQIRSAQRQVLAHPRSTNALVALGNAYLQAGDTQTADQTYLQAMRMAPKSPEAPTLHAMVLGAEGESSSALKQLRRVESENPKYAKAWLVDGLLASQVPGGRGRAIGSWRRFLTLQPRGALAATVRQWIARTAKSAPGQKP